jgi:hypothetical protein
MAIFVKRSPEGVVARAGEAREFATSAAFTQLRVEMLRYVMEETQGRSFLISGHRGAGKTTLLTNTIADVTEELADTGISRKPLYVRLHGPDLLPNDADLKQRREQAEKVAQQQTALAGLLATSGTGALNALTAAPPIAPQGSTEEIIMKQVAISLYRAAADEFSESLRLRVANDSGLSFPEREDLLELAAQARIELDAAPDLNWLRTLYFRANRLRTGVLFRVDQKDETADRALLELIAIGSAAQAYRVVTGTTTEAFTETVANASQQSLSLSIATAAKNLLAPLIGLASGSLAGATLVGTDVSPYRAIAVGLLTGLTVTSYIRAQLHGVALEHEFTPTRARFPAGPQYRVA